MNYQIGHVYKIICSVNSEFIYIGSTFRQLTVRWNAHKSKYNKYLKGGNNKMSTFKYYDKYGIENFKIILIKSYKVCTESNRDNIHLRAYEQLWINKTKNSVNLISAFNPLRKLDKNIYRQNNKEKVKEWRNNNKEKIKEQQKEYYQNNKEKHNKKMKEYHQKNKEKVKEYHKEWYNNNKEELIEKRKQKITCECGSIIRKPDLPRHKKSKKHAKLMQNNNTLKIL